MVTSDAVIGYVSSGTAVIGDYWLGAKQVCTGTAGTFFTFALCR